MLTFFRTHQRWFLIAITIIIILSFSFFGTYSAFFNEPASQEVQIGTTVDNQPIYHSHKQAMIERLSHKPLWVQQHFIDNRLFEKLASPNHAWAESLRSQVMKEQRHVPYQHPNHPFISSQTAWQFFAPHIPQALQELQKVNLEDFPSLVNTQATLFAASNSLPEHILRQILYYQESQIPAAQPDSSLANRDLSLVGCRTLTDWFKEEGVDLMATTVMNGAAIARKQGFQAPRTQPLVDQQLSLFEQLSQHLWACAKQEEKISTELKNAQEEITQVQATCFTIKPEFRFTKAAELSRFLSYQKMVEENHPDILRDRFSCRVTHVTIDQAANGVTLKQVWEWQVQDANWAAILLRAPQLGSKSPKTPEERYAALDKLNASVRLSLDQWCRQEIARKEIATLLDKTPSQVVDLFTGQKATVPGILDPQALKRELLDKKSSLETAWTQDQRHFYRFDLDSLSSSKEITPWTEFKESSQEDSLPPELIDQVLTTATNLDLKAPEGMAPADFAALAYFLKDLQEAKEKLVDEKPVDSPFITETTLLLEPQDPFFTLAPKEFSPVYFGSNEMANGAFLQIQEWKKRTPEELKSIERALCHEYVTQQLVNQIGSKQ